MKNCSYICGVLARNILALLGVGIFISTYIEHRNSRSPIPNGFCTVRSEIVPCKEGDSATSFSRSYYNFSFMQGTMKNCVSAQGASNATSAHETSMSIYCRDNLLKSIESLFDNYDIGRIALILNDILYFASTPEDAKDLDLDYIKSMAFDCTGLIHALSSAYVWYKDMEVENAKIL